MAIGLLPEVLFNTIVRWAGAGHGLPTGAVDLAVRNLAKLTRRPVATRAIASFTFHLDCAHPFHRAMALGRYEPETLALFQSLLRPGDTYVDVGAEVGYFAAQAWQRVGPTGRLHLFEPDPRAHERLRANLALAGGLPQNIQLNRAACSDQPCELRLALAPLSGQSQVTAEGGAQGVTIAALTLDRYIEENGIQCIKLLKMDVEGHEIQALRGGLHSLQRGLIRHIIIEKNNHLLWSNGYSTRHLHALFAALGYVGYTEFGTPVDQATLEGDELLNLLYTHESEPPPFARNGAAAPPAPYFNIQQYYEQALSAAYPGRRINRAVDLARAGQLDQAIAAGLDILAEAPGLTDFKGHVAYWLTLQEQNDKALELYREILRVDATNHEVRSLIARLSGRLVD